jgi:chromosome segregation ATPase
VVVVNWAMLLQELQKSIRDLKTKVQGYVDDKESMMADHQELIKRRSKLELDIRDLEEEVQGDRGNKVSDDRLMISLLLFC